MRRLILEFRIEEISKFRQVDIQLFQKIKTLEVLQDLRRDPEEVSMICRIELEDNSSNSEDFTKLLAENGYDMQLLEREKDGAYIAFIKINPVQVKSRFAGGCYLVSRQIREDKIRMTLLGSSEQVKELVNGIRKTGIRCRINSLADATYSMNSPLNFLTEKQRAALISAYRYGYYDLPRKINSEQLAKKLNIHKSALATHRRKAEARLIAKILKEYVTT
jgi:hypothetical protein